MRSELLTALRARLDRFAATADPRDVLDADAPREAAELMAASDDPERDLEVRRAVGWLHWHRYGLLGDESELRLAETLLRPVYEADPLGVPEAMRSVFAPEPDDAFAPEPDDWAALSDTELRHFLARLEPGRIAQVLSDLRDEVSRTPPHHPGAADTVVLLCVLLSAVLTTVEDPHPLRDSVEAARRAADALPPGHARWAAVQSQLGDVFRTWYLRTGEVSALHEAIDRGRRAVDADPSSPMTLSNLAIALLDAYRRIGDLTFLEEAIATGRGAVDVAAEDDPQLVLYLSNLGGALHEWADRTGDDAAEAEALRTARRAVALTGEDHPARPLYLSNLASSLKTSYDRTKNTALLAEAVEAGRRAVSATPAEDPSRPHRLGVLGGALQGWFEATDELSALDEAVEVFREALHRTPEGHPRRVQHLHMLSYALLLSYDQYGTREALHEVIAVGRRAMTETPADHPDRGRRVVHLVNGLRVWYEHTGDLETLDEAITLCRHGLATGGDRDPGLLSGLVVTLRLKYERTRDRSLLEEAVAFGRESVAADPHRRGLLVNFGSALAVFAEHENDDLAILDEAIDIARRAADLAPHLLTDLVGPLLVRYERTGDPASAEEAVAVARRALALTSPEPERAKKLFMLGQALAAVHKVSGDPGTLTEAIDAYLAAATVPSAAATVRVDAGFNAGRLAMSAGRTEQALSGYATAVELLPLLVTQFLDRSDAEHWLTRYSGLAASAAACALEAGDPERAVTLLEQGRGVLLDRALSARTALTALRERAPELADRFQWLSAALETEDREPSEQRHEHARDLEAVVERIRALPDFASFLLPPTLPQLMSEVRDGPVVLVNVSQLRCDALALTPAGVRHIPLPDLTLQDVVEWVDVFVGALDVGQSVANEVLETILGRLWDTIAEPVLTTLEFTRSPGRHGTWPRLWWAPVGPLSYLPLHAAGHHDTEGRSVLDRVISPYTPTLRALTHLRGRRRTGERAARHRPLVVSMPRTPGAADLPGARDEAGLLAGLLPDATSLTGPEATRDQVDAALREATWAHFACHAQSRFDDPSSSLLLLHDHQDKPFDVRHLSALRLPFAELAYLSACGTSRPGRHMTDEAVHISAAFQLAGFPHVIGTLWTIKDRAAPKMARAIYTDLLHRPQHDRDIAQVVHRAAHRMRQAYPRLPLMWAAHLHVGL
ncbi:CHAT domain-containing protein [Streptomyces sp. Rer75]|uniref:CHAT domain-containing tetratricopeptide repeat protein n=1 Tax=Streptomyces sp. Rer75 TaxID=2750011 RepID=UPI0015D04426|nr:CHAT domain-containing protein [Streptomyces sp. Rer75]QLH25940.1 CHAT domain-containing protein [Streptomyces sp. Rer75]